MKKTNVGTDIFSNFARPKFSGIFLSPFISAFKLPSLPVLVLFYNTLPNAVRSNQHTMRCLHPQSYRFFKQLIHFQVIRVLPNVQPLHIALHSSSLQCEFSCHLMTIKPMPHILITVKEVPFVKVPIFILIKNKPVDIINKPQMLNGHIRSLLFTPMKPKINVPESVEDSPSNGNLENQAASTYGITIFQGYHIDLQC